jgi:serine/threonine protein phosphatase 1
MNNRLIAIGDIHGCSSALAVILKLIEPSVTDTIVTLGDVIDWGPDSKGVIDTLLTLDKQCNLVPILGNHEDMLLYAHRSNSELNSWLHSGGQKTLDSYGPLASLADIPPSHMQFLKTFRPCFETDDHIFVHANYCWYSPLKDQPSSLLRWISIEESEPKPHLSGKTVILGHLPGPIRNGGFFQCLDTGCGLGGCLTAMDLGTGHLWQVDEIGQVRQGGLA